MKKFINQLIRVNHAGEFGAKRIYEGQMQYLKCHKDSVFRAIDKTLRLVHQGQARDLPMNRDATVGELKRFTHDTWKIALDRIELVHDSAFRILVLSPPTVVALDS